MSTNSTSPGSPPSNSIEGPSETGSSTSQTLISSPSSPSSSTSSSSSAVSDTLSGGASNPAGSSPPASAPPTSTPPTSPPPTSPPPSSPPPTSVPPTPPPTSPPTSPSSPLSDSSSPTPSDSGSGAPPSDSNVPPGSSSGSGLGSSSSFSPLQSSTSTSESTFLTTNSAGQTVTSVQQVTIILPPSNLPNPSDPNSLASKSPSHTGPIVGGVVGGLVGLLALALLAFFCVRRHKRRKDEFDGDFDPDRVTGGRHGGPVDLAAGGEAAPQVTPYNYAPEMSQHGSSGHLLGAGLAGAGAGLAGAGAGGLLAAGAENSRHGPPTSVPSAYSQPSQYGGSSSSGGAGRGNQPHEALYEVGSDAGMSDGARTGTTSPHRVSVGGMYGDWRQPSPGPSLPTSGTTGTLPSQKEMEARGLRVHNRLDDEEGDVVQHTDGGRVPAEGSASPPREIPPSYDSIRD
ncbi:hypothetical protein BDW22DRAFT_682375 [Trametopsis cervina]|nr:hypothetical protein BDW22DRAFT_682375 [Trametopsis cervina]